MSVALKQIYPRPETADLKILIAPDSFKGSLSAPQVAEALRLGMARRLPDATLVALPLADGGEGTLDCLAGGTHGIRHAVRVSGADGRPIDAALLTLDDGTAVLESANVVGLPLLGDHPSPPSRRSSRGLGELALAALDRGCRRIAVALGGSSTNDGGAGLLTALGARLLDGDDQPLCPIPEDLARLARVDFGGLDPRAAECEWIGLCDVDNPLTGARGATAVYGPQKGVAPDQVGPLDAALARFGEACSVALGRDAAQTPGAGAAGGLGFALLCLNGRLVAGADYLMDLLGIEDHLRDAALVVTGEGRSDGQTLQGKLPARLAARAKHADVPVVLVSGAIDADARFDMDDVFAACFSIADGPRSLEEMLAQTPRLLEATGSSLGGLMAALLPD